MKGWILERESEHNETACAVWIRGKTMGVEEPLMAVEQGSDTIFPVIVLDSLSMLRALSGPCRSAHFLDPSSTVTFSGRQAFSGRQTLK